MFGVAKTTQLIAKLARTATTEMKLLRPGRDFVSRTIKPAATNGTSKIYQGNNALDIMTQNFKVLMSST